MNIDIAIDCVNVDSQAAFWSDALGYRHHGQTGQYRSLVPRDDAATLPKIVLQRVTGPPKNVKNRLHLDLIVGEDIEGEAERLVALGARRVSDRLNESGTSWIVMADPEGNEFCVCVS